MNCRIRRTYRMAGLFLCLLLSTDTFHAQLPGMQALGYLNTYETNKFYWGVVFEDYGRIRSINQTKYRLSLKGGEYIKGKKVDNLDNKSNIYLEFDERGNMTKKVEDYIFETTQSYTYRYDASDNLLEMRTFDRSGDWIGADMYTYDESGQLLQEEIVSVSSYMKYYYNYNEYGEIVDIYYTELHGYPLFMFFLDVFVLEESSKQENIYRRILRSYDPYGNLVEETTHYSNENNVLGGISERYTFEYDDRGNLCREIKMDPTDRKGRSYMELNYTYDKEGLLEGTQFIHKLFELKIDTKIIRDADGMVTEIIENQKNQFNRISYSSKFEYDDHDNVSKIYFFKKDRPKFIVERKIEYY